MPISGVMHSVSGGGGGGGALPVAGWGGSGTTPGDLGGGAVLWNVEGRSIWSPPASWRRSSPWILASDGCTAVADATAAKAKRRATSLQDAIDLLRWVAMAAVGVWAGSCGWNGGSPVLVRNL
jgi:hypothetical protein